MTKLKVFLSWSGERSRLVAEALEDWLPCVFDTVEPFLSTGIPSGTQGLQAIQDALKTSKFGIVCLTVESYKSQWVNFEAGALSMAKNRVCPYYLDGSERDYVGPLNLFQMDRTDKDGTFKLIESLAEVIAQNDLPIPGNLQAKFERYWPELESAIEKIPAASKAVLEKNHRNDSQVLDELLQITRHVARHQTSLDSLAIHPGLESMVSRALFSYLDERNGFQDLTSIEQLSMSDRFEVLARTPCVPSTATYNLLLKCAYRIIDSNLESHGIDLAATRRPDKSDSLLRTSPLSRKVSKYSDKSSKVKVAKPKKKAPRSIARKR